MRDEGHYEESDGTSCKKPLFEGQGLAVPLLKLMMCLSLARDEVEKVGASDRGLLVASRALRQRKLEWKEGCLKLENLHDKRRKHCEKTNE